MHISAQKRDSTSYPYFVLLLKYYIVYNLHPPFFFAPLCSFIKPLLIVLLDRVGNFFSSQPEICI